MPFTLKLLATGVVNHTAQTVIYTVPAGATGGAIVSNVRFVNTTGSALTLNLSYNPVAGGAATVRLLELNKSIPAGDLVVLKPEITMATGDTLEAIASATGIDFVVSGMERS